MSLELVNTSGTLLTVAIVAATAIAALVQLRHLRAGNQINAMLSIGNQFDEKEFRESVNLVREKLDASMDDPLFRDYWLSVARSTPRPEISPERREIARAALLVGNAYEELGILLKNDVIDKHMFLDRYCYVIELTWKATCRLLVWMRETTQEPGIWENFEYLTVLSQDFSRARTSTYPPGVRRIRVECPWPVPAAV